MISRIRSFSGSLRSPRTMPCSVRRSLDGRRTRWSRRSRRGGRPWTSGKWMTVRVRCRATSTGWGSGRWTSGTSTPSRTTVALVGAVGPFAKDCKGFDKGSDKGRGKGFDKGSDKGKGKGFDKGKGKGSGPYQGYGYQQEEEEEEAIEQVECQTCSMVGQVDEVIHPS